MAKSVVEAVFTHAKTQGDKFCLADDEYSVTYSRYTEKIKKAASIRTTVRRNATLNIIKKFMTA